VTVATHRLFESETRHHGLGFAPLDANPRELLESDAGRAWLEAGANPIGGTRRMLAVARPCSPGCWPTPPPPASTPT
jgi:hypothetical protein